MPTVNIHHAKTHLSRLLADVAAGKEVIIARAGTPVARLVKMETSAKPRKPGALKGQIWMADDFDAYDAEITRLFESSKIFPDEREAAG